jgi:competence protein ComEA
VSSASPPFRGVLSRVAARVIGSRFAKPVARVVLVAAGLVLLAVIGRASAAGALGRFAGPSGPTDAASAAPPGAGAPAGAAGVAAPMPMPAAAGAGPMPVPNASTAPTTTSTSSSIPPTAPAGPRGRASSDDPVVLNTAGADDLRRLPGIGQKRADAILALRARMGRFRAIEDLMKVKGIGRAMLRRLRPLVRLDAAPPAPTAAMPGDEALVGAPDGGISRTVR